MRDKILRNLWWATFSVAVILLVAHSFRFPLEIDNTSIFLLIVMLLSPFVSTVRKLKFGDFEAEIDPKEVTRVREDAERGLAQNPTPPESAPEISRTVAEIRKMVHTDQVLALAKLRIEIEKVLRRTAEALEMRGGDLVSAMSSAQRVPSIGALLHRLAAQEVIPQEIATPLRDVIALCNRAIHGEVVKDSDAIAIVETGTGLLESLYWEASEVLQGRILEEKIVSSDEVEHFQCLRYRLTTVIPLLHEPKMVVREVTKDQLDDYLEGYYEYAEFVVRLEPLEK